MNNILDESSQWLQPKYCSHNLRDSDNLQKRVFLTVSPLKNATEIYVYRLNIRS